jgi:hypothetical protein
MARREIGKTITADLDKDAPSAAVPIPKRQRRCG